MSILDRNSYITIDRTIIYMNAISYTRFITKEQYIGKYKIIDPKELSKQYFINVQVEHAV
jgi:hypothetical protein